MRKLKQIAILSLVMVIGFSGCAKKENTEIIGGADEPATIVLEPETGPMKALMSGIILLEK